MTNCGCGAISNKMYYYLYNITPTRTTATVTHSRMPLFVFSQQDDVNKDAEEVEEEEEEEPENYMNQIIQSVENSLHPIN